VVVAADHCALIVGSEHGVFLADRIEALGDDSCDVRALRRGGDVLDQGRVPQQLVGTSLATKGLSRGFVRRGIGRIVRAIEGEVIGA